LTEGTDYKVNYSSNKKSGTGKFKISFIGNYKGSKAINDGTFSIAPVKKTLTAVAADKIYNKPDVYTSKPYVTLDKVALKASDYTVKYYTDDTRNDVVDKRNNPVKVADGADYATVYFRVSGKGNYEGSTVDGEYKVWKQNDNLVDLSKAKITLLDESGNQLKKMSFTGKECTPNKVVVTIGSGKNLKTLDSGVYTVDYVNNINTGKATVVIKAVNGNSIGSKTTTFTITKKKIG
jgi:hypothetical protein